MNRAPPLLRVLSIQHRAPRGLSIQHHAPRGLSIQHRAPPLLCGLSIQRPTVPFSRLHSVLHLLFSLFFFFPVDVRNPDDPDDVVHGKARRAEHNVEEDGLLPRAQPERRRKLGTVGPTRRLGRC